MNGRLYDTLSEEHHPPLLLGMAMTLDRPPAVIAGEPSPAPAELHHLVDRTTVIGGAALVVAGVMHAATISAHSADRPAVWTFLLIAAVQLVPGSVALARPGRRVGAMVAVVGGAALAGWSWRPRAAFRGSAAWTTRNRGVSPMGWRPVSPCWRSGAG